LPAFPVQPFLAFESYALSASWKARYGQCYVPGRMILSVVSLWSVCRNKKIKTSVSQVSKRLGRGGAIVTSDVKHFPEGSQIYRVIGANIYKNCND
jgi:hypothetical protein